MGMETERAKTVNIAIDGPAGAGKSTVARQAAARLNYLYLDTGALYRAIAWYALKMGKRPDAEREVTPLLEGLDIRLSFSGQNAGGSGEQQVFVNGENVSALIRTPEISAAASLIAAIGGVRDFLLELQRKIAAENNVLMDGRDIGTVVLPDADLKIFLTASPEERARRRHRELMEKNPADCPSFEKVLEDIVQRDYQDSHRAVSPLRQAPDAVLADSSHWTREETVEQIVQLIVNKLRLEG